MASLSDSEFKTLIAQFVSKLGDEGFAVDSQKPIDYGVSLLLSGGGMLNLYNGKKGPKVVTTGKLTQQVKDDIEAIAVDILGESQTSSVSGIPKNLLSLNEPWIGCDEAGKGDYFGPLVVAAVAIEPGQVDELLKAGVRDSKNMSNPRVLKLCGWIQSNLHHSVEVLMPEQYNTRYSGNLNDLLSELHASTISDLAKTHSINHAISDRFGNPAKIKQHLKSAGVELDLTSIPRAEADVAVAAASIVARGLFLEGLKELGNDATINIPPGAGPPVIAAGRELVKLFGKSCLKTYAKLHFKTTEKF